jgi:hypothetical protein
VREQNTVREKRDADGTVVVTRLRPGDAPGGPPAAARGTFVPADAPDQDGRGSEPRSPGSAAAAARWTPGAT